MGLGLALSFGGVGRIACFETFFDRMSKDEHHMDVRAKRERVLEIAHWLAPPKDDLKADPKKEVIRKTPAQGRGLKSKQK